MVIGIVTTWFERGAAYVSKAYRENLINKGHQVFIYARGGENKGEASTDWNGDYVTYGKDLYDEVIDKRHLFNWIQANNIEAILFNEQRSFNIVAETKKKFPNLKLGCYVDYYTETTLPWFEVYDFLICNTRRHEFAMSKHPQKYYLRWGTDVNVFTPNNREDSDVIRFFHSVGMSPRKGTDILLESFIEGKLYEESKLIIHTQIPIEKVSKYKTEELKELGIEVIEKTVTAPGLYYLGDVYVYPTRLDGLGLTMYEALASGMPVITTDNGPMNEIINNQVGKLVSVDYYYCRKDAYYWPMSVCHKESLQMAMKWYINNPDKINIQREAARNRAIQLYDWSNQADELSEIFEKSDVRPLKPEIYKEIQKYYA